MKPDELRARLGARVRDRPVAAPARLAPDEAAAVRARRRTGARRATCGSAGSRSRPSSTTSRRTSVPRTAARWSASATARTRSRSPSARSAFGPGTVCWSPTTRAGTPRRRRAQLGLRVRVMDLDPDSVSPTAQTAAAADAPGVAAIVVTHLHGDAVPLSRRSTPGAATGGCCSSRTAPRPTACGVDGVRHVGPGRRRGDVQLLPDQEPRRGRRRRCASCCAGEAARPGPVAARVRLGRALPGRPTRRTQQPAGRAAGRRALAPGCRSSTAATRGGAPIANRYRELVVPAWRPGHHGRAPRGGRSLEDRPSARRPARPPGERGIMTAVHYPWLVSEMPGLAVDGRPGRSPPTGGTASSRCPASPS